ncbi:MAG: ribonuclease HII [Alphaproteobacteria bacterium]|nr:ribonuclease HII [Alphaproteobacteria bacterium]MBN2675073.1 ribonuclease HII [Alphaproteobacteria bacterium]
MKSIPNFNFEKEAGFQFIAGCDEAGRGPLCGPVVAAAVIFPDRNIELPILITDSKQMNHKTRKIAYDWITENTIWAVGQCSAEEIDDINILWASMLAMKRAVESLSQKPEFCLVDGNRMPKELIGKSLVKGDAKSVSIAAASIIAKETRDKIMCDLALQFPEYCWDKNAGYPTKMHLQAIEKYGINQHYRKTFRPIKDLL